MTQLINSCDTLVVRTMVWFSFGDPSSCPLLSHVDIVSYTDTMELKLYYDISGPWPQVSCMRTDTITTSISPNTSVLKGVAYSINGKDTVAASSMQIQICSPTAIKSIGNESFNIFPNPTNGEINLVIKNRERFNGAKIEIYNTFGENLGSWNIENQVTLISIHEVPFGLYFLKIVGTDLVWKIIKK